jgi:small-conductance mechanosensitive channel
LKTFNDEWDARINKYRETSDKAETDLKAAHKAKYRDDKANLFSSTQPPTYSPEFIHLQEVLQTVVKSKDYKEAHTIQGRLKTLAEEEKQHWLTHQRAKLKHHLAQLKATQEMELTTLQQRSACAMNELHKRRSEQYQAFINRKKGVPTQLTKPGKPSGQIPSHIVGSAKKRT